MWKRDAGVSSMIEYLDRDLPLKFKIEPEDWAVLSSAEKFSMCSPRDREAILEQARDCADDFTYAARNYFWITTKKKQDVLFSLWEGQYLILQKYYEIKEKGRSPKLIVIKARQLGCSVLIEAMIAWRAMFFPNTNAIVVSVNADHSGNLFRLMLHIYDKMPWWLKPMTALRKETTGLFFENPDPQLRTLHPGVNSKVMVQWSNQYSGVGQGIAVDAAHVSEFCDFFPEDLEAIVHEDLGNSMAEDPEVFGFMESTGKGAGTPAHELWMACEARLDAGKWPKWYPFFLPSFFETTRVLAPPGGWAPPKPEQTIRDRVRREWLRCNNPNCGRYQKAVVLDVSREGLSCPECSVGKLNAVVLTDEQLYWHQDKREEAEGIGTQALKKFLQEQCSTAEQAFQVSGYVMFNDTCREWMSSTIEEIPLKKGKIYRTNGEIHGADLKNNGHCYISSCGVDHRGDDTPLTVWREPEKGSEYSVGVDVSEGIGQDYSVIFVNKIGKYGSPDEQVAVWRDNHTQPKDLAFYANVLGRWYNDGLMCVEYNTYQTTGDDIVYVYQYPNVFRWKHKDSIQPMSQKHHWWTKVNTKSMLHQTAVDWLLSMVWIIRSKNFLKESMTYQKEEFDSRTFGAEHGFCDDELMAGMIALYCLAPESRVLTNDLRWVPIEDMRVGDKLIAFDEDITCRRGSPCLLRESEITSHKVRFEPRFEIVTDQGSVIASGHHGWATLEYNPKAAKLRRWVTTENLKPGSKIIHFARPWESDNSPESQWLAGILDGEGCVTLNHKDLLKFGRNVGRGRVAFSQKSGVVLDKAIRVCHNLGINTKIDGNGGTNRDVKTVTMRSDSRYSALEIIGRLRPVRLLENARKLWIDRPFIGWHWWMAEAVVIKIRPLGVGPVISVGTTTKTLFAEGMASHNCAHELDCDETGRVRVQRISEESQPARYRMSCQSCKGEPWGATNPETEYRCPYCGSIRIRGELLIAEDNRPTIDMGMLDGPASGKDSEVNYDML